MKPFWLRFPLDPCLTFILPKVRYYYSTYMVMQQVYVLYNYVCTCTDVISSISETGLRDYD